MPMYNLIEYYRNEPNDNLTNSESFKFKQKLQENLQQQIMRKMLK